MIAKMIAHAPTREAALDKLADALDRTIAAGPHTNLGLLAALCRADEFRDGTFDTGFIDENLAAARRRQRRSCRSRVRREGTAGARDGAHHAEPRTRARCAAFALGRGRRISAHPAPAHRAAALDRRRAGASRRWHTAPSGPTVAVDGVPAALDATAIEAADAIYVLRHGRQTVVRRADLGSGDLDHGDGDGQIRAPMHGKVLALLVSDGERVEKGQRLAIIEAMKMEHALVAPHAGRVAGIAVAAGSQVAEGARLMTIETAEA